jgi:hypothetical protein
MCFTHNYVLVLPDDTLHSSKNVSSISLVEAHDCERELDTQQINDLHDKNEVTSIAVASVTNNPATMTEDLFSQPGTVALCLSRAKSSENGLDEQTGDSTSVHRNTYADATSRPIVYENLTVNGDCTSTSTCLNLMNNSRKSSGLLPQSQCANSARPSSSSPIQINSVKSKDKRLHHNDNGEKHAGVTMHTRECSSDSMSTPINSARAYGRRDDHQTKQGDCETSVEDSDPDDNSAQPSVSISLQNGNELAASSDEFGSLLLRQATSATHKKRMLSVATAGELNV